MTIDEAVSALYAAMCFDEGARPDWERLAGILPPDARLVRVNDDGVFEFNPATFRRDVEEKITSGALPSFRERELSRRIETFGDIAHVLSVYEGGSAQEAPLLFRAVKSIQLFRRHDRWWISALLWRREGRALAISDDGLIAEH